MSSVRICPRCHKINPAAAPSCTDCGAALQDVAVSELTPENPVEDRLRCPTCAVPMHSGRVILQFPAIRWTWRALFTKLIFQLSGRREWTSVVEHDQTRRSARCPRCGGVWIGLAPLS